MNRLLIAATCCLLALGASAADVDYQVDGTIYQGYYLSPAADAPLVLLLHDWDGLTGYEKRRAQMLAKLGYAVFAADLFGKGVRPDKVEDRRQHTGELYRDRNKMRRLMEAALETAEQLGSNPTNAVAMGYCFGGAAVLELARSGSPLKGFVSFHGGLGTPPGQNYQNTRGRVLIFHGSADQNITMQDFAGLAVQLEQAGVSHEMITYGGAPHAFTVFDSSRYRPEADQHSWQRFLQFLEQ